jgi:hypothetical protein
MSANQPATIHLDVGSAHSVEELYVTISAALGRPCPMGPYSVAWELDEHRMPVEIDVTGFEMLRDRLPSSALLLMTALKEVAERHSAEGCVLHVV